LYFLVKTCGFVVKSSARNSFTNDSRPHSVAIGDFNNDGLLDIVVPNSGMNNIGVFLRHVNGTFKDQMIYSTGIDSTPYAVAVTDFNQDQQLDIAVANFDSHTIGIFLGTSDGTFRSQTTFSTGSSRPRSIAVGDFNNDAELDIAIVNYGTNNIGVFLQDRNGSFANQITFFTGYDSDPYALAVGDLNNDNKLDIIVANYGTNNVGILLGLGNGTFAIQIIFSTGINSHPYSIAIDNLNSDTYLDIVVACSGTNNVGIILGYGDGTFTIPTMYSTGNNSLPLSVAIADLDNDNKLDIAVGNYDTASVVVLLGDGNGNFSVQKIPFFNSSNSNPYSIAIGDFNADNRSDIAVVNYDFNYVDIILNYRNYSFLSQTTYTTNSDSYPASNSGSYPTSVVIADLNNDKKLDIIVANYGDNFVEIFLGYGDGTFSSGRIYSTGGGSGPCSIVVGDFNNDNQSDIVVTNYWAYNIGVFLGYGDGTFSIQTIFSTGHDSEPCAVDIGDFNSNNRLDIVVANFGTANLGVFLGYGNGIFSSQVTYSTGSGSGPHSVATGDFNNDSQLDIVVANFWTNNVGVFLGHGDGTFSNQTTYSTDYDSRPSSVAVGDFNNDSRRDIIVANYWTGTISLFLGYGNGAFSNQITFSTGSSSGPWSITIADFNNDNRLDIAVANQWSDNLGVFFGYGNGSFSNQTTYSTGSSSSPLSVAVGNLNDDGHPDIAVANSGMSNVGLFIGYGNGSFTTQQTIATAYSSLPISVAVGDFNDDGRLDIMVTNFLVNNIGIFLGDGNGTFSSQTTYDTGAWSRPYSFAVGDFNNDSRLDIVVANSGTNNVGIFLGYGNGTFSSQTIFSTGYNSQPYAVAVGDFNKDNRLDIAVTNSGTNNVGIFLGYGNGTFVNKATYTTGSGYGLFSIAVGDFNNDDRLDIVVTNYNADNIGVFLGYGNGTFSNQTTYSTTRGSWPTDVVVGDLNNDGRLDIVVTLLSDFGIIVFLGNGNGTFSRQLHYSTGSQSRPYACILGDVNNDNRLDVAVSDLHNGNVVVLLGDGNGSFSNKTSYSTGNYSFPSSVAFGDFNNDSILDIVVANHITNTIGVFLGFTYINGVREDICSTGSSSHPRAVALADFNKDTQLDIVMANYELDNVEVLLQDTNKTFSMQIMFPTGALSLPTSVAVGDFNNDSELDIAVANSGTENIGLLFGYGNGTFMNQTTFSTGLDSIPQSLAVGDFNNDKRLDIVVADSGTESVLTLLRYDIGALGNQTMYPTGTNSFPVSVTLGDLNNDGWLDFVVANYGSDNVGVFLGLGNGTFSSQTTYSTGSNSYPYCIAVADFNKDSHLDIIVCNYLKATIGIFLGFGNGTFSVQTTYPTGIDSGPIAVAIGDFNNDSQLDIVVANYRSDNIGIFLGYDNGTFSNVITYSAANNSLLCSVAVGDFNNDNRLDIVVVNSAVNNLGVFIGYGNGTFSVMITCSTGSLSVPLSVVVGDFNNDGRLDVAVSLSQTDSIGVLFGNGNGTFSNQMTFPTGSGSEPNRLAIGDFNNDNQLDIAIANYGSNSFDVLLGCANGTFFSPLNYFIGDGSQPNSIAVGDFNNDSRLDIIVTSTFTDNVGVFLGYVSESFLYAQPYSTGLFSRPTSITVGDFDNDTRLDVVVANNGTDNIMVLFGSGYGTFVNQTSYSTGYDSNPCWVAVGDFNNDNRLDIVVANSGTNNVGIFLSNGTGTFSNQTTYSTYGGSQPNSVAVLDFNNDTRLDIAVANYGSNSVGVFFGYGNGSFTSQLIFNTSFDSHPFAVVVGDVNNDNLTDIIATNNGYGNIDILLKEC
jgi:predicted nucleotidyltransferase